MIKKLDKFIILGFVLIPFNDFFKISILNINFSFPFFWLLIYIIFSINKKYINDNYSKILMSYLIYLLFRSFLSCIGIREYSDLGIISRNIMYGIVYIVGSVMLYSYLCKKDYLYIEKILKYSFYSFFLTGLIEMLNPIFKFYPRIYNIGTSMARINPLSSESSYYIINIIIPFNILLYMDKNKKEKIIFYFLSLIIILNFSATGFLVYFSSLFFYFVFNIKKRFIYKKMSKLFVVFCIVLIFVINVKKELGVAIFREVNSQSSKIVMYLLDSESKDYSTSIRKIVRDEFGKKLFMRNKILGVGIGGIYKESKYTKKSYDAVINSDAKNLYWTILAEQGIVGMSVFLFSFISIYFFIIKNLNKNFTSLIEKGFLFGSLVFFMVMYSYKDIWIQSFWFYLSAILAMIRLKNKLRKG